MPTASNITDIGKKVYRPAEPEKPLSGKTQCIITALSPRTNPLLTPIPEIEIYPLRGL